MNTQKIIELFNSALAIPSSSFKEVNRYSLKCGYIVPEDCCSTEILDYFKKRSIYNVNSTFYKTWENVLSRTREEIWEEQIKHYISTYGTNFEEDAYVPNEGVDLIPYNTYKILTPITLEDLIQRCLDLTNVHLDQEDIDFVVEVLLCAGNKMAEIINTMKNIEVQVALCSKTGIKPSEKFQLLRYISYKAIKKTTIIQNRETILDIKASGYRLDLSENEIKLLSSIFLRYKNFFLAFKASHPYNANIVNRMRRLAIKTHTPLKSGFWETILSKCPPLEEVLENLDKATPFKKILIMNTILERLALCDYRGFLIRNGKFFIKENSASYNMKYYLDLLKLLKASFSKKQKIKVPSNIRIAAPTSSKSFIGNLPYGSQYNFEDNKPFVGIYWRNEWNAHDFDLAYLKIGGKIGWNAAYNEDGIVYSGDMTNANPEASEVILFTKDIPDGIVRVNRYCGDVGAKYQLILGSGDIRRGYSYCVNPNDVHISVDCISTQREQTLAYVHDRVMTLLNFSSGNKRISNPEDVCKYLSLIKAKSFVYLDELCEVVSQDYEGDDFIDLTVPTADNVINCIKSSY